MIQVFDRGGKYTAGTSCIRNRQRHGKRFLSEPLTQWFHRRVGCPAGAGHTQYPLKKHALSRGIHLPLIDPAPSPRGLTSMP